MITPTVSSGSDLLAGMYGSTLPGCAGGLDASAMMRLFPGSPPAVKGDGGFLRANTGFIDLIDGFWISVQPMRRPKADVPPGCGFDALGHERALKARTRTPRRRNAVPGA